MASFPSKQTKNDDNEAETFEPELVLVDDLRATDVVLCQAGCASGIAETVKELKSSIHFHTVILSKYNDVYSKAKLDTEKRMVVKNVLSDIVAQNPPGVRFLEVVDSSNEEKQRFVIVPPSQCLQKIEQFLSSAERAAKAINYNASNNNCTAAEHDATVDCKKKLIKVQKKSDKLVDTVDCNALSKTVSSLLVSRHKGGSVVLHSEAVNHNLSFVVKKETAKDGTILNGQPDHATTGTEYSTEEKDRVAAQSNQEKKIPAENNNAPVYPLSLTGAAAEKLGNEWMENRKNTLITVPKTNEAAVILPNEGIADTQGFEEHIPRRHDEDGWFSFEEEEENKHHHGQPNGFFDDVPPEFTALYTGQLIGHCHDYLKLKDAFKWQHSCAATANGVRVDIPFPLPPSRRRTVNRRNNKIKKLKPVPVLAPPKEPDSKQGGIEQPNESGLEMGPNLVAGESIPANTCTHQDTAAAHHKEQDLRLAATTLTLLLTTARLNERVAAVGSSHTRSQETAAAGSLSSTTDPTLQVEQQQQQPAIVLPDSSEDQVSSSLSISATPSSEQPECADDDNNASADLCGEDSSSSSTIHNKGNGESN